MGLPTKSDRHVKSVRWDHCSVCTYPWPCREFLVEQNAALREALITLVCHDCGDMFTETVGALLATASVAPLVPMLCTDCGEGGAD